MAYTSTVEMDGTYTRGEKGDTRTACFDQSETSPYMAWKDMRPWKEGVRPTHPADPLPPGANWSCR